MSFMSSKVIGKLNENSNQRNIVYDKFFLAPTLQAAMGTGGCQVALIIVEIKSE